MQNSIFIAKLMGPTITAVGLSMVINREAFNKLMEDVLKNAGAIIMIGVLTLLAGLAVVNTHNIWVADWPVVITIFGWAAVGAGLFRILAPGVIQKLGRKVLNLNIAIQTAIAIWIGIGLWLSYQGYLA